MGNFNNENLIPFTGELKPGQRLLKRPDGYFLPVGMAGGSNAVAGYFADLDGNGLKFYPVGSNNGESVNQIMIADTGENEPEYEGGNSMDFYKCASVTSDGWTGYKAIQDTTTGIYNFESTITSNLTWDILKPEIDSIYTSNALIKTILYSDLPTNGRLVYAKRDLNWTSNQSISQWGDFSQSDTSIQPQIATVSGLTGIKANNGQRLQATVQSTISNNFTLIARFAANQSITVSDSLVFLSSGLTSNQVVFAFGANGNDTKLIISQSGVSYISGNIDFNNLQGEHTVAVTFNNETKQTRFYLDGYLQDIQTYYASFIHTNTFIGPENTGDNLVSGLAAYNRILSDTEIAGITW